MQPWAANLKEGHHNTAAHGHSDKVGQRAPCGPYFCLNFKTDLKLMVDMWISKSKLFHNYYKGINPDQETYKGKRLPPFSNGCSKNILTLFRGLNILPNWISKDKSCYM